ncbi:MAG: hypothetical protein PHF89_02110 [Eubacteriales bacterium]|nr:hypothetical protein [Eubacteriales bacterium]
MAKASNAEAKILKKTAKDIGKKSDGFYAVDFVFAKNGDKYTSTLRGRPILPELQPVSADIITTSDIAIVTKNEEPIAKVIEALKSVYYQIQSEMPYLYKK